jgi:hypothetical protein
MKMAAKETDTTPNAKIKCCLAMVTVTISQSYLKSNFRLKVTLEVLSMLHSGLPGNKQARQLPSQPVFLIYRLSLRAAEADSGLVTGTCQII